MRIAPSLAALLVGAACGRGAGPQAAPFPGSATALDSLGAAVVAALASADQEALEGFRLTERQHNEVVWPELPASNAEAGFPVDFAWANIEARNAQAVDRGLSLFRGRAPVFEGTECRGPTERFRSFRVHTDCWVNLSLPESPPLRIQLFEDVLERGGGYKIFRYYDNDLRLREVPGEGA